jgi:AbrB family looped-hinge helix DNA binding protein
MYSKKLSGNGRVVIPAEIRRALGIQTGDTIVFELLDGEARISTRKTQLRRARELFRQTVATDGSSLADELIAGRRAEV